MKQSHLLSTLFILCFALFSCETENDDLILEQESNVIIEEVTNSAINSDALPTRTTTTMAKFIAKMHWASFITGKLLFNDTINTYRSDFINIGQNSILLEDLIGNNPTIPAFKTDFINLLTNYIDNIVATNIACPDDDEDTPGKTPVPENGMTTSEAVDFYLDFMLNDNCIELDFPNGLVFPANEDLLVIASTAHPLTISNSSFGIERYKDYDCLGINLVKLTDPIAADTQYFNTNGNIILARPKKATSFGAKKCTYTEYNVDFTDFPNN